MCASSCVIVRSVMIARTMHPSSPCFKWTVVYTAASTVGAATEHTDAIIRVDVCMIATAIAGGVAVMGHAMAGVGGARCVCLGLWRVGRGRRRGPVRGRKGSDRRVCIEITIRIVGVRKITTRVHAQIGFVRLVGGVGGGGRADRCFDALFDAIPITVLVTIIAFTATFIPLLMRIMMVCIAVVIRQMRG